LWLPGGRLQFAMIPMNFLAADQTAGYIDSGFWADEAAAYARHYGNVAVLSSSKESGYSSFPQWPTTIPENLAYLHLTTNNTIYGTQLHAEPEAAVPIIADMSSDILSRQRDYSRYALFYAVAQKNIGAAGVTLVVVRRDMLQRICRKLPPMLDYNAHVQAGSVLNTPPVFSIYTSLLMLRWIKQQGIETIEQQNREKARLLYEELERNSLFTPIVDPASRSWMNVVFRSVDPVAEQAFLTLCAENGIEHIRGHRKAGAFRASLYNAMPLEAVQQLVNLMREFESSRQGVAGTNRV
jgi:phosphoserine aminotransferase